mmetsp:Transcript_28549/g.93277  ORF Transcript_28549/g.93277 Transcript_28549/m.93277 type:complete len:211 (+) Transcript_28549:58-690(+)
MQITRKDLNLIFWGVIIILLDFHYSQTTNGVGFKFDFIPDILGAIMIFLGVFSISGSVIANPSFLRNMRFVVLGALIQIVLSIDDFFIYHESVFISSVREIASILISISIVLFSSAMIVLSDEKSLKKSSINWRIARRLFLWLYIVPEVFLQILSWFAIFPFDIVYKLNSNAANYIVLFFTLFLFLLLPLIYGLYAIQRMRKEIRETYLE